MGMGHKKDRIGELNSFWLIYQVPTGLYSQRNCMESTKQNIIDGWLRMGLLPPP